MTHGIIRQTVAKKVICYMLVLASRYCHQSPQKAGQPYYFGHSFCGFSACGPVMSLFIMVGGVEESCSFIAAWKWIQRRRGLKQYIPFNIMSPVSLFLPRFPPLSRSPFNYDLPVDESTCGLWIYSRDLLSQSLPKCSTTQHCIEDEAFNI